MITQIWSINSPHENLRLLLGTSSNSSASHEGAAASLCFPVFSHLSLKSELFAVNKNVF